MHLCRVAPVLQTAVVLAALGLLIPDQAADAEVPTEEPVDAPRVVHVAPVAPHILALEIHAGSIPPRAQTPYTPQPGDEIKPHQDHRTLAWLDGKLSVQNEHWALHRDVDGQTLPVAFITADRRHVWPFEAVVGTPLDEAAADQSTSYAVSSDTDPNYADATTPLAVHRKSKPRQLADPDKQPAMLHRVYLELPHALRPGGSYTITLHGVDTTERSVAFSHRPRSHRTEALHVSQVGYRPSDPHKAAYLSLWLGTGGGVSYDHATAFELLDGQQQTVFTGPVRRVKALGENERLKDEKDYAKTAVYRLDFGAFQRPGTYTVHVPGIGVSAPFRIDGHAWRDAFAVSMLGHLHHRSGLELGPPLTDYHRPRPFHPEDGVRVFQLDATMLDGESAAVNASLRRLTDDGNAPRDDWPDPNADAWGGYMDAGDWDRRSPHLDTTYLHLELLELFPAYFERLPLRIPAEEANNHLPDLLDEALWNLAFYRRVQHDNGGVPGGVESTAHPRWAEASWQESLGVGLFAPDRVTSLRFAAAAAKAARLLRPHDAALADDYENAAEKAWAWIHRNDEAAATARTDLGRYTLAAVELFWTTGEARCLPDQDSLRQAIHANETVAFVCARLPEQHKHEVLRAAARQHVINLADRAIAFAEGNPFGLATPHTDLPAMGYVGYLSVPGMISRVLPRAHFLTGDERYLAAAVRSADFSVGANPDNLIYTTGLGWNAPRFPLHIDSRITGQPAPAGITVYGPCDPAESWDFTEWMHRWFLGDMMTPDSRTWPMYESYVDGARWPAVNEYTVHQTLGPTSYTWGYLAARPALQQRIDDQ